MQSLNVASQNGVVTVSWTAPFTLDITDVDPDIEGYCVNVVNSTTSATLQSECDITETEFSYVLPPRSVCTTFIFTIIPRNLAGNGTSASTMHREVMNGKFKIKWWIHGE